VHGNNIAVEASATSCGWWWRPRAPEPRSLGHKNGIKKTVTLVADYGPGFDAEKYFADRVTLNGGQVLEKLRTPLRAPDFAPVLQKVRDAKPDALFVFLPSGQGAAFMKQFAERGPGQGGHQADRHRRRDRRRPAGRHGRRGAGRGQFAPLLGGAPSAVNKKFVADFMAANKFRPNFMAVGGYDGMRVIYKALEASKGAGGDALLAGMKGQLFESPRGQVLIDAQTRDIVHDMYIRKVEKKDGQLWNVEFDAIKAMKDPGKSK
jgi:branched-chain amino acid transport system substrate-binding protein